MQTGCHQHFAEKQKPGTSYTSFQNLQFRLNLAHFNCVQIWITANITLRADLALHLVAKQPCQWPPDLNHRQE